jgi:hypothetical protein
MMTAVRLSQELFLKGLPEALRPQLPSGLDKVQARQPYRWLMQFHYGEPELHYEVSSAKYRRGWELGLHCESRDRSLNRYLLDGFRRHLFEIKDTLGEQVEAEMWDRGWTKIYEVYPADDLTQAYQAEVGQRLAQMIVCLQPILIALRQEAARRER